MPTQLGRIAPSIDQKVDHPPGMARALIMDRHVQARGRIQKFVGVDVLPDRAGGDRRSKQGMDGGPQRLGLIRVAGAGQATPTPF